MGLELIKLNSSSFGGCKRRDIQKMRPTEAAAQINYESLLQTLANNTISAVSKQQIMQRAVSSCPSVNLKLLGLEMPSLLDSGSMVTLVKEGYFDKYILPKLKNLNELSEVHSLFKLTAVNNGIMPVLQYFEADMNILRFTVPQVGFLIVKDPNTLLTPPHSTQLPGVIGCKLIRLGCEEFGRVYGFHHLDEFTCPGTVHPVMFSQLCTYYHQSKLQQNSTSPDMTNLKTESIQVDSNSTSTPNQNSNSTQDLPADNVLGQVWVGDSH